MLEQPMLDVQATYVPSVIYRPILPSDLDVLEQIHAKLFPIRYEREFFLNVVNGHGIVSWAAVDIGLNSQSDELIGFVTTRVIAAHDSEIEDLLTSDASRKDATLVYILTLGVVERYRNHGIAGSLVREVTKYASSMTNCRAVYLHVIAYNQPAINFYQKMQFKLIRKLHKFYYIKGRHYDAYLFVYYVNGGRSPCSPLDVLSTAATYIKGLLKLLATKLWKKAEKKSPRWSKCKESSTLLLTQNKRIIGSDNTICQCV
ncbi:histone acetyltransferase MCC1 isoform X2 [Dioscorea cayenensis subsp. rotundata]|uniref:N-alpha-acetyltransferase 60 n=1 Tax=Dioscorea cayennensis subsp. rotundata TaxID=55577 RepID=A0AB40CMD8_DIOCR|nr:histone acetyltransferase MCC1 isoform X2 [Dioscorea cayenensis subsp. rotundata]